MHLNFMVVKYNKIINVMPHKIEALSDLLILFLFRKTLNIIIYNLDMRKNKIRIEIFSLLLVIFLF